MYMFNKIKLFTFILALVSFISSVSFAQIENNEQPQDMDTNMSVKVKIDTSVGSIELELDKEKAPITVENFLSYIDSGFYTNTIFHRVIPGFMIQGGGMDENLSPKQTKEPIVNEAKNGLKNDRGSIAMARTQVRDSATSQFFINLNNNDFLNYGERDYGYAVFGKVTSGMDVVDKIASVKTASKNGHQDVPVNTIFIKEISIIE